MAREITDPGEIARLTAQLEMSQPITAHGAPFKVRAAVAAARIPADKLATLRNFYPDARPLGDDNFVFTDDTGQRREFDSTQEGFAGRFRDLPGDLADVLPEAGAMLGGTIGAGVGASGGALGGGAGAIPGFALGAGAGGNLGREATEYAIRSLLPQSVDQRGVVQKLVDQTGEVALNAVGEGAGRALGGMVTPAVRGMFVAPGATDRMQEAAALGLDTAGMAAEVGGRPLTAKVMEGLTAVPSAANTVRQAREATLNSLGNRMAALSGEVPIDEGNLAMFAGGQAARAGQEATGRQLHRAMLDAGQDVRVTPSDMLEATQLLAQMRSDIAQAPAATDSLTGPANELAALIENAQDGGIPFRLFRDKVRNMRQSIEGATRSGVDRGNYTPGNSKAMQSAERALRSDARTAVQNQAPDAMPAVMEHDRYFAEFLDDSGAGGAVAGLMKGMGKTDTNNLGTWAMSGAKKGPERLQMLRSVMPEQQWETFSNAVLHDWGRSARKGGEFSVDQFVTKWNQHPDSVKQALFGDRMPLLERLAEQAKGIKEAGMERNFSNTAPVSMMANLMTGAGAGAAGALSVPGNAVPAALAAVGTLAAPYGAAKFLTGPGFQQMVEGGTLPSLETMGGLGMRSLVTGQ